MAAKFSNPRKSLNKSFLKIKPNRNEIEQFKSHLSYLFPQINEAETEEFHKNIISRFLEDAYYKNSYYINTKGNNDLVIHNGRSATTTVGVIIEAKKPNNKNEMISHGNFNAKSFQELILYYLRERISGNNLEIRHLIVTNIYEWFIFDAELFEKAFAQNKNLVKHFLEFEEKRLSGKNTDFFYKEIATPAIEELVSGNSKAGKDWTYTYFDVRNYKKIINNNTSDDDRELISLYKLLSPEHLLKLPFRNDSNSLDKDFYAELLHVIGLTEIKQGSKKVIQRKELKDRNKGSIIENAITQLEVLDKIARLEKPSLYGGSYEEQCFNVALELVITWVNRILFLKLLEAQLLSYHKGDKSYSFLNSKKIKDFDDLNSLFFQVLARKIDTRDDQGIFDKVPYLNSSLFEPTNLEHSCFFISQLQPDKELPVISSTVLKDQNGKKIAGSLNTLEYLFSFLDAYDFSSEGAEDIQEENKSLISASVLGLIFEKINGYKDGSFFTPGFITMYMCRETIRDAVIQKFNDEKKWVCTNLEELFDKIENKKEANEIINGLKICDPAVGSGHFLVSALNEIIAIKSELKILLDRNGRTLRDYHIQVSNDELIVTDDNGQLFDYNPRNTESQLIQEALFHEKQTIIENCLFGVDINPNSVKICRLRLWIELLKNAYYKPNTNFRELETLPNIDINIKCGNSLISRFDLNSNLSQALKKSKITIKSYKNAVQSYRHATSKENKREMEQLITAIKSNFRTEISSNDPKVIRLQLKQSELSNLLNQHQLFDLSKSEQKEKNKLIKKLEAEIEKLTLEIEQIKNNKIYENAFEWRFEFPEVLDSEGDFRGFDLLIGNPPYGIKFQKADIEFFKSSYSSSGKAIDSYGLFIELANRLAKNSGHIAYIVPTGWYTGTNFDSLRQYFAQNTDPKQLISLPYDVFADAWVDTTIFISKKREKILDWPRADAHILHLKIFNKKDVITTIDNFYKDTTSIQFSSWFEKNKNEYILVKDSAAERLISKIRENSKPLSEFADIQRGVTPFHLSEQPHHENAKPAFNGTVRRYKLDTGAKAYIRYDESLAEFKPHKYFTGERILLREIISRQFELQAMKTSHEFITNKSMQSILVQKLNPNYILAIINSKLMSWYFLNISQIAQRDDFPKIVLKETRQLPIYDIDIQSQSKVYNEINNLVEKIIDARNKNASADTSNYEVDINAIVYQLYGLSQEEISLIETGKVN